MIKYIIKRDGSKEEFSPLKINGWGEWAARELGDNVDWSQVVLDVTSSSPEEVTSVDLHKALIRACLDNDTWGYNLMAGRLYASSRFKDLYGGNIPTIKSLHSSMIKEGLMVDLGYSQEEYDYLEGIIDHSKDFKATHFELNQIREKYSLKSRVSGKEFESQQFVYMRMAMALAQDEEDKLEHAAKWYEHLSEKRINAPTPNYVNLGTKLKGYASCAVYTTEDTADSIEAGVHIAYTMTHRSAGIGAHMNVRSLGDPVRGGLIRHQGKLPYLRYVAQSSRANLQASRGGAVTMYINCYDPEIETLLNLKNPMSVEDKKIRELDYGFSYNRFFVKKAARGENIFLFNGFTAPDLYQAMYSDDEEEFERLYNKYEEDTSFEKIYVEAREILKIALTQASETGRMYEFNTYEANHHTPFKDKIYSSNLCVAPETKILTKDGYKEIKTLKDQEVEVWNGEEWSKTTVRKTGENQKLVKVETDSGHTLECTPYHKFYVVTNYYGGVKEVEAKDLKEGDKLIKFDLPVIDGDKVLEDPYLNGFYSAGGCFSRGTQIVYLYKNKFKLADKMDSYKYLSKNIQEDDNRITYRFKHLKDKFFVPSSEYNVESRLEWLAGFLDGDGSIYNTKHGGGVSQQITASSVNLEFLKEVQLMLHSLGIHSKITKLRDEGYKDLPKNDGSGENGKIFCKKSYRLVIPTYESFKLLSMGLNLELLEIDTTKPNRDSKRFVTISSIVDEGRVDDSYCFTEPKRNMGVFNGILTGNCSEIALPTKGYRDVTGLYTTEEDNGEIGLCSLAGIVYPNIESDEQLEEVMYYALKMIDKCIHLSEYPFPHLEYTAKSRLSAGIGIIGLAHYLAKRKLSYSTQEGRNEIHRIAEKHMYFAIKASLKLSKELGVAPWMHKTKWVDGWLPIDTYNKNVDKLVDIGLQYDWEALRKEIVENGGIRNSVLVAHMPSESSSIASGTTNSIYPIRNLTLIKGDNNNRNYWAAPEAEELARWYEIAYDVPHNDLVACYGIIQKFTDQAISADVYQDILGTDRISSTSMIRDFLTRVKYGLKSRYYMNTRTTLGTDLDSLAEEVCESCTL